MRVVKKIFISLVSIVSLDSCALSPYFSIRSQSVNAARDIAGMVNQINLPNKEKVYGSLSATFEYDHSFHACDILKCLFGPDVGNNDCPSITVSGTQSPNRGANDWLADYFGLQPDFKSVLNFNPYIQNFIVDLNYYLGLDEWLCGLYFRIDAPITQTKWYLNMCEHIINPGALPYPAGYFSGAQEFNLLQSFSDYASGNFVPKFNSVTFPGITFPASVYQPLGHARISPTPLTHTGLAELRSYVGWNWQREDYHIGLKAILAAPTGSRPNGNFAFEPIVGNAHHWEFGGGLSARYEFWINEEKNKHAGIYIEANVTHMCKSRQHRTFDLKNKPNSRYMLAQKIGTTQLNPHLANPPFPPIEFQSDFSPVSNLTNYDVDVKIAVQGDAVVLFNYTTCGLSLDVGYNLWARSCEEIIKNGKPSPLDDGVTWALKGDASVIGFEFDNPTPVRLAATERTATIHAGTNFPAQGTTNQTVINTARSNPNIDTPFPAEDNNGFTLHINPDSALVTNLQTNSSLNPVFLNIDDVNIVSTGGLSNKLFAHLSYAWMDRKSWKPYIGCGAQIEWGKNGCGSCNNNCGESACKCCTANCNPCTTCSLSQWGVWIKGGVSF